MNLLDLFVRVDVDDRASDKIDGISAGAIAKAQVMGQAFYDAAKMVAGKVVEMGEALVSGALEGYGRYEQLAGGVEKLYGDSADTILKYAKDAYKTAGLSANDYMEQATGFSAALIKSLGGDTKEAAKLTDVAMRAMSDNVNVFGSDMESVQNAFQGFAKENYTMLDNLKMGYAGTKEGAKQLVADAAKATEAQKELGLSVDGTSLSFDNLVKAVAVMEKQQGIWGTTSKEAMTTIEGSINATKAAWDNLLTAIGSGDPEMITSATQGIIEGVFGTIDEESGKREGGLIANVVPVLQNVANAVMNEMPGIATQIWDAFSVAMQDSFGVDMSWMDTFADELKEKFDAIVKSAEDLANGFNSAFNVEQAQQSLDGIVNTLDRLWQFVETMLSGSESVGQVLGTVANTLTSISTLLEPLANVVLPVLEGALSAIGSVLQPLIAFVTSFYTAAAEQLKPALEQMQPAAEALSGVLSTIGQLLSAILTPAAEVLGTALGLLATGPVTLLTGALSSLAEFFQPVTDFFVGLPETLNGSFEQLQTDATNLTNNLKSDWDEMLANGRESWDGIRELIGKNVLEAKDNAIAAFNEIRTGIEEKVNEALEFVTSIPGQIEQALGDLGNLLWGAGQAVIDGLLGGMQEAARPVFEWVGGIADTIASLKGPLPYDKKVLVNNGTALMEGLKDGIELGFEKNVKPAVKAVAKGIDTYYGTLTDNRKYVSAIAYPGSSSGSSMTSATWGGSSGGNMLSGIATGSSGTGSSTRATWSSSSGKSTTQKVRDEAVISILRSILAAMPKELKLDTKGLAEKLAPDMNVALGRL